MSSAPAILAVQGIGKRFGAQRVLSDVDLQLQAGEMLALVGANGAGKSTLVKIICGALGHDEGSLTLAGEALRLRSVADAMRAGIAVAHQQIAVIPILTAAQNIMLGREPRRLGFIDADALMREARQLAQRFGVEIDLARECGTLSVGENKIIDILKALAGSPRVLVLDEPTASLTLAESRRLFDFLGELRRSGLAILFISHHMNEVFEHCDRVVVLKDGCKVHDGSTGALTREDVIRLMVGRSLETTDWASHAVPGEVALQLRDLRIGGLAVRELTVHRGEVVGIAGVLGAGQTALLESLAGHHAGHRVDVAGRVAINGLSRLPASVAEATANGIYLVADERLRKAIFPQLSVEENLMTGALAQTARHGFVAADRTAALAQSLVGDLRIKCASIRQDIAQLSGGNQQKVVFGRWLGRMRCGASAQPPLFLLDNPTEGVDVGAKAEIYALIRDFARSGASVLISSAEFGELLTLCDRICVIRDDELAHDLPRDACSEERLLLEVS